MWCWREFYWNIVNYWRLLSNKAADEKHRNQTYMKDALTLFDFLEPSFFRATTKFKSWPLITKSWPVIMKISSCHRENLDFHHEDLNLPGRKSRQSIIKSWSFMMRSRPVIKYLDRSSWNFDFLWYISTGHSKISTFHNIFGPCVIKYRLLTKMALH